MSDHWRKCLPSGSLKINALSSLDETNFLLSSNETNYFRPSKVESNFVLSSKDEAQNLSPKTVLQLETWVRGWRDGRCF
jgi:hypothetical protein